MLNEGNLIAAWKGALLFAYRSLAFFIYFFYFFLFFILLIGSAFSFIGMNELVNEETFFFFFFFDNRHSFIYENVG